MCGYFTKESKEQGEGIMFSWYELVCAIGTSIKR
jgi:hypothetical protein